MATLLLKTEPGEYAFSDLQRDGETTWSGVTSNAALAHMRAAARGDHALIYHTGAQRAVVGLARLTSGPYADPENPGVNDAGQPRFPVFDVRPLRAARTPVGLAQLKADRRFKGFALVRQPRLSVVPVPPDLDAVIRALAGL